MDNNLASLYAALAAAQGAFPPIAKNREVTIQPREGRAYRFKYADLENILAAVRPALAVNGLAFVQPIVQEGDVSYLRSVITHKDGAELASTIRVPSSDARDPKQYGALLTYLRRYMACSILGVAADDDLDEDGHEAANDSRPMEGVGNNPERRPVSTPRAKPAETSQAPSAATGGTSISAGQVAYLKNKSKHLTPEMLAGLLSRHGAKALDETITEEQFAAIKAELSKAA